MSALWTCARVPSSVPHVPDLLSLPEPMGRDPRGYQSKLVTGSQACGIRETGSCELRARLSHVPRHGFLRTDSGGVMGDSQ